MNNQNIELERCTHGVRTQQQAVSHFLQQNHNQMLTQLVESDLEQAVMLLKQTPHALVQKLIEELELLGYDRLARDVSLQLGIIHSEAETAQDYLSTTVQEHVLQRIGWIMTLALLGIVSGLIIATYEDTLNQLLLLAVYMPVIAATGGNTGTQAATLVIRALATDELQLTQWRAVLKKELLVGSIIAAAVTLVIAARVMLFSDPNSAQGFPMHMIAVAISVALFVQVVLSTAVGGVLPIMARKLNLDPALLVSPMLASIVDISGIWIYFNVVNAILNIG